MAYSGRNEDLYQRMDLLSSDLLGNDVISDRRHPMARLVSCLRVFALHVKYNKYLTWFFRFY